MIVIFSPTKTMVRSNINYDQLPKSLDKAIPIFQELQSLDFEKAKSIYKASDKIVNASLDMLHQYNPTSAAIFSFTGASFKAMNIESWDANTLDYANTHLFVLSALFGIHQPLDTIAPYRLDYMCKLDIDLYSYWKQYNTDFLNSLNAPIINLASKEYAQSIDFENINKRVITIEFKEFDGLKYTSKSTYIKPARGAFAKVLMINKINDIESVKSIEVNGYSFSAELSNEETFVYVNVG